MNEEDKKKIAEIEAWGNEKLAEIAKRMYEPKSFIQENWEKTRNEVFATILEIGKRKFAVEEAAKERERWKG